MSPRVVCRKSTWMWLVAGIVLRVLAVPGSSFGGDPASDDGVGPKYIWKTGKTYYADFQIEASIEDVKPVVSGNIILSPTDFKLDAEGIGKSEGEEGTGTGFVVHPDGVLVTCAHVVRGAVDIQANFGEKKYKAKVIGYDAAHDVALLKIEASQLACLNLGDSSHVELGEEVRVVGFPLTDMLGENVKITRGTISGINQKKEGRVFQIDASINPGNSGGPLVDGKGRVVGLAKALLTGEAIDRVGFATPIEDAVALLRQKKISLPAARDAAPLDGPALARQTTPAVALIKVRCGAGGYGTTEQSTVQITGVYSTQIPGSLASMARGQMRTESCRMNIDTLGNVTKYEGTESAPMMFDRLGTIGIDPLPSDGRMDWSSSRMVTMIQREDKSPSSPGPDFGLRPSYTPPPLPHTSSPYSRSPYSRSPYSRAPYTRPPYSPPSSRLTPAPPSDEKTIARVFLGMEEVRYHMDPVAADGTTTIHKEYELSTARTKETGPTLEMKGTGTIIWVKGMGVPKSVEFKGTISQSSKNVTIRVPMTMTCKFSDKAPEPPQKPSPAVAAVPAGEKQAEIVKPAQPKIREQPKTPVRKITSPPATAEPVRPSYRRVPASSGGLDKFNPDE